MNPFRLAVRALLTEANASTLRSCGGRNLVYQNEKKRKTIDCLHFTCGKLQLLTSNHSRQKTDALLMGCVRVSGAPDSSRRQPEKTYKVFSWTRSSEPAAQKNRKLLSISFHAREPSTVPMATSPIKNCFHQPFAGLQANTVFKILSWHNTRKKYGQENHVPVMGLKFLDSKKGKRTLSGFLFVWGIFSRTSKYESCLCWKIK